MSIWGILEVEPTQEISIIKKAYAKKLKSHHPEDDPEGYQQLREAFDAAVKLARKGQQKVTDVPAFVGDDKEVVVVVEEVEEVEEEVAVAESDEVAAASIPQFNEWNRLRPLPIQLEVDVQEHPAEIFDRQIRDLYADFSRRINPASWHSLLSEDFMWSIEHRDSLRDKLMLFLHDHRNLPHAVWEALDSFFHLREDKEILISRYDNEIVEYIQGQIDGSLEMRYECFLQQESLDFDIEHYLNLRFSAQLSLMEDRHAEAGQLLDEANALFQHDPDLQLMRAKYCLDTADYCEAMVCLNRVITMCPNEMDAYLLRGRLLYYLQRFEEAMNDCEFLLQDHSGNKDVQCLTLECNIAMNQMEAALIQVDNPLPEEEKPFHFRFLSNKFTLQNTKLYPQSHRSNSLLSSVKNITMHLLYYLLMFLKLSWLYILGYAVCYLVISNLHPLVTTLFTLVLLWNVWKTANTAYIFSN